MERSLVFTRAAARALARMPRRSEELIRRKLQQLAEAPASLGNNVKALKGREEFRLRVGVEVDRVIVHDVGPRRSIYD